MFWIVLQNVTQQINETGKTKSQRTACKDERVTLTMSKRCSAMTASFPTISFSLSWVAWLTIAATSGSASSRPCLAANKTRKNKIKMKLNHQFVFYNYQSINSTYYLPMLRILRCRGPVKRKFSSLQDLICVPTNSAFCAMILALSSTRFTPPMVATSLMSSSSLRTKSAHINT